VTLALAGITQHHLSGDAESALANRQGTDIEAVLLDVLMPGRKGNEILQELLASSPTCP
jgi:DNA-binding NtrC family response regulator